MEFAGSLLAWIEEELNLLRHILWSDEAVFHVGGFVNRCNCHYWASKETNPDFSIEKLQARPSVAMWCTLVSPYILHDTMNVERYIMCNVPENFSQY